MKINTDPKWLEFSNKVREKNNNLCFFCQRPATEVRVSVYRKDFLNSFEPYLAKDYFCLCTACFSIQTNYKK